MSTTTTKATVTKDQIAPFFKEIVRKSDNIMLFYLIFNFIFGLFLASFYSTWSIALLVGSINLATYFLSKFLLPKTRFYQYVGSAVTAVFAAQFIYQMHGMFEMHFWVFIASFIIVTYQNWKLQLPLIILVVIHHATFAYLQYSGYKEIYFSQLEYMDLSTFLFHGVLAAAGSIIAGYWSWDQRNKTISSSINTVALESQLNSMNKNISFAEQISEGNLKAEYELTQGDELGKSLLYMRDGLLSSYEREQQEKFTNLGLAQVGEILRNNMNNIESLSDQVISKVVKYIGANQGGIFIQDGEVENDLHLTLKACYAYNKKKFMEKRIDIGQGLVGQAYLEKSTIHMTKVPDNYINITSGLGEANPRSILVVPLKSNDDVVGIIELASMNKFEKHEIAFIEKISESIASTIISVKINERTKKLLENTRLQAEEMRAQEEEMRQNMEELSATQEEMYRKEREMMQQIDRLLKNEESLQNEVEQLRKELKTKQ